MMVFHHYYVESKCYHTFESEPSSEPSTEDPHARIPTDVKEVMHGRIGNKNW